MSGAVRVHVPVARLPGQYVVHSRQVQRLHHRTEDVSAAGSRDPTQTHQRSRSDSQWTRSGRWSEAAVRGQPHCSAERRRPMPSASCPNQEQPDASGSDDSFMTSAPAQALRQSPSPSVQEPEWRQERPFEGERKIRCHTEVPHRLIMCNHIMSKVPFLQSAT